MIINKRKGKEYNKEGKLIYEGEYINNQKYNGIEYDKKGNKENEIKNGNGKVKEYHDNGKLKFEGEYKDGKKHGKAKEYSLDGKLVFDGEYLNDKRNGKAKEYNYNGLSFEGEYKHGQRIKGKEYSGSELIFDGEYKNGEKWNGYLKVIENDYRNSISIISFEGEFKNGKCWNGKGFHFIFGYSYPVEYEIVKGKKI